MSITNINLDKNKVNNKVNNIFTNITNTNSNLCSDDDSNDDELTDDLTDEKNRNNNDNDNENVPDVDKVEFISKEKFYLNMINKFFKNINTDKVILMLNVIEGKSKISLRLLDWFVTRYANKYKICYSVDDLSGNLDSDNERFNVHISYKAQLKSYKKKYFDPFRRRKKFNYYFDKEKKIYLCTTIGQLNFFRWAFTNKLIEYVDLHYDVISKAMITSNKEDKKRKLKDKNLQMEDVNNKDSEQLSDKTLGKSDKSEKLDKLEKSEKSKNTNVITEKNNYSDAKKEKQMDENKKIDSKISLNKNGININAQKINTTSSDKVKIILSFD